MSEPIAALVMAGGRFGRRDEVETGLTIKALARIDGETLLERALRALSAAKTVGPLSVVGAPETRPYADAVGAAWTEDTGSLLTNVQACAKLSGAAAQDRLLLFGADLAFPNSRSIDDFLHRVPVDASVATPLVRAEDYERVYVGSPGGFVRLKEGRFTIGSQFVAPAGLLFSPPTAVCALLGSRKSQVRMAGAFGFGFVVALLTGSLTIAGLEARASELVGAPGKGVPNCAPDLAFDIDDARDLAYARSLAA